MTDVSISKRYTDIQKDQSAIRGTARTLFTIGKTKVKTIPFKDCQIKRDSGTLFVLYSDKNILQTLDDINKGGEDLFFTDGELKIQPSLLEIVGFQTVYDYDKKVVVKEKSRNRSFIFSTNFFVMSTPPGET